MFTFRFDMRSPAIGAPKNELYATAIKRAARHGLGFISQGNPPGLLETYHEECRIHGHTPGFTRFTNPDASITNFVAEDIDRAWAELGLFILHDAVTVASYREGHHAVASSSRARTNATTAFSRAHAKN